MDDDLDYDGFDFDEDQDLIQCPSCRGTGYVNPLTAPSGFFCATTTQCPTCDGTGEVF